MKYHEAHANQIMRDQWSVVSSRWPFSAESWKLMLWFLPSWQVVANNGGFPRIKNALLYGFRCSTAYICISQTLLFPCLLDQRITSEHAIATQHPKHAVLIAQACEHYAMLPTDGSRIQSHTNDQIPFWSLPTALFYHFRLTWSMRHLGPLIIKSQVSEVKKSVHDRM